MNIKKLIALYKSVFSRTKIYYRSCNKNEHKAGYTSSQIVHGNYILISISGTDSELNLRKMNVHFVASLLKLLKVGSFFYLISHFFEIVQIVT